ncbi:MAG: (2Fe-2S) ferredoxin domain-containing protein [Eubacteriales bacterium]|nr:(2Fe-2S) ferredoxin domain-containing protein [Eubacteriales bacterium]
MKKTIAELQEIREQTLQNILLRTHAGSQIRVIVAMSDCGIAAGAREVCKAFVEEIKRRNLSHVSVTQQACQGTCHLEPMVEIHVEGQDVVSYVKIKPEYVAKIVEEHIVNGKAVKEYTL